MAFDVSRTNIEISATDKTKVAFDSIKSSIGNLTSQFGGLTGLLGAGAFVAFTKRIIDQADGMNDLSKRTGIAVDQIGAWRLATEQSGTSMDALTAALGKGSKYLVQHGDDLKKIGINAKTSEELILKLSGIISQMPSDDPRRTALAMQVLGKSAGELIPLLSEGEQGLRKMLERGRELNPVTAEMAKNADAFNDNLAEMKLISGGLFVDLVGKILPSLNTYLQQLKLVVDEGDWMDKLAFFSLGYVPGKIADKTEKPEVQIQKYTQRIVELKKELADFTGGKFGYRKDGILEKIAEAEDGLAGQRARLPRLNPKRGSNPSNFDATNLDAFLKSDSAGAPKRDAIAERIKALATENNLLAQGVPLEDARTIARLKGEGATDKQIVSILNATSVQNQFEEAQKTAEKTQQDLKKATEDHAEAMRAMLETADEAVISAQRETAESQRSLQVMQLGESAVIRMEAARLNEAAASAEQGLAYAKLNGLSQENIDFTEAQILRLRELAKARFGLADSTDATEAFEKEKDRIKDLEKEQIEAAKRVADDQKQNARELSQALTNGFFDSFKKGESFGKSMLKNLAALAKTWAARLFDGLLTGNSAGIAGSIGALFSGSASASTGGASGVGSLLSGGGGISGGFGNLVSSLFKGAGAQFSALDGIVQSFAGSISNAGFPKLASALFQNSSAISSALPYAGAAFSLLTGDFKGAATSAIGTAIGSFTPLGPIGGAIIGSFISKAFGGLFGGKKITRYGTSVIGEYDGTEYKDTRRAKFYDKDLGAGTALSGLNKAFADSLGYFLKGFDLNSKFSLYSSQYQRGKSKKSGGIFGAEVNGTAIKTSVVGKKLSGQQVYEMLTEKVLGEGLVLAIKASAASDGVKKFFNELTKKEDVAEAISTLVGLNEALADLPPVFNAIKNAIDTTSYETSIADLKTRFAAIGTYTSLFYTAEEQFATFTKQLTSQTTALGLALPKTRDEYRGLVDGINVVDESSSSLFTGLVALAPAMDNYFKQLEAQKAALDDLSILMDESSFKSLFDYNFYKGLASNYGTSFANQYTAGNLPTYGASDNTSVAFNPNVGASNNTTISTSDPNMANAMATLISKVNELQTVIVAIQANTKSTAQTLTNISPDGDSIQTTVVA